MNLSYEETQQMDNYAIDIQGSRSKSNIWFKMEDCQKVFNLSFNIIDSTKDIKWIGKENIKERYLSYEDLKRQAERVPSDHLLNEYIAWIDNLVDDDDNLSDWSSISMIDDNEINHMMIDAYHYKIDLLTQIIETKNKDILLRDKDIEIMQLKHEKIISEKNNIIQELIRQVESLKFHCQWI